MTDRKLMQQALDALEYASEQTKPENLYGCDCLICKTILALRERLAQPEQEREKVAKWMIERGYATGHGDNIEGLLKELEWQILERLNHDYRRTGS